MEEYVIYLMKYDLEGTAFHMSLSYLWKTFKTLLHFDTIKK